MEMFIVKVVYYYPDEDPWHMLESSVSFFNNEEDAIKELNRVIREDWTTEIPINGDVVSLADCPGQSFDDVISLISWSYSEDKKMAWSFFPDGHGYKGEVSQVCIDDKMFGR